jgi:hypothetical protein
MGERRGRAWWRRGPCRPTSRIMVTMLYLDLMALINTGKRRLGLQLLIPVGTYVRSLERGRRGVIDIH